VISNGFVSLAKITAVQFNLIPSLVCGICEQESSWDPDALRYEGVFFIRYIEPMINSGALTDIKEAENRATSWGLMQVMGQVAREMLYTGPFPFPTPAEGIRVGCEKFARCVAASKGDMVAALLRYNGGGNPNYPREVIVKSAAYGE
jgi:soluble lytic murein transglycosylase-like protein